MARHTDEELFVIVNGPAADWQPEAIEAARRELENRDLAPEREEIAERLEQVGAAARAPLEPWKRPVALVAGLLGGLFAGVLLMFFDRNHQKLGEKEKSRELRTWFFYGLVLHFLLLAMSRCL